MLIVDGLGTVTGTIDARRLYCSNYVIFGQIQFALLEVLGERPAQQALPGAR